jgi:hypothetical protein
MIPDIQSIFDSTAAANGPWVYVGKYSIWTLYVQQSNDGTVSVEAASIPTNNFVGIGNPANIGIQINNLHAPVFQTPAPAWTPSTTYALNALITDYNNNVQKATTPGTSGTKTPTFATSGTTTDNTVVWTFQAAQGDPNYNSALISSASPAGVIICPSMSASTNFESGPTGAGYCVFTSPNALYIPEDDIYVGYIRVRKTGGGAQETIAYLCGQVDS